MIISLESIKLISILVHSRIYFRCQNNFYLAAFNITLLENFCVRYYSMSYCVYIFLCCKFILINSQIGNKTNRR